jgi:hypothetical protein
MEFLIIFSASLTIAVVLFVMKGLWAADRAPVLLEDYIRP